MTLSSKLTYELAVMGDERQSDGRQQSTVIVVAGARGEKGQLACLGKQSAGDLCRSYAGLCVRDGGSYNTRRLEKGKAMQI